MKTIEDYYILARFEERRPPFEEEFPNPFPLMPVSYITKDNRGIGESKSMQHAVVFEGNNSAEPWLRDYPEYEFCQLSYAIALLGLNQFKQGVYTVRELTLGFLSGTEEKK